MHGSMIAKIMAAAVLAMAAQAAGAWAQPAQDGRALVPGHRYTVEELAAQREAVLAIDAERLDAWKRRNVRRLDTIVAGDAKFVDGLVSGAAQVFDKAGFLDRVRQSRLPRTLIARDRTVRLFGVEDDVAIVNGEMNDPRNAQAGGVYTAIYLRTYERSWELVRYQISPLVGDAFQPASIPHRPWSPDALSPSQRRVAEVLRAHFDAMSRRDDPALERTIGDEFWYIRGGAPGGNQHGKAEYMAFKRNSKLAPEMIVIDEPQISFYGNYGEVAVVNGLRRDATGGAVFGSTFTPQWRALANYTAVVVRPSTRSDVWVMQHYHAAFVP